MWRSVADEIQKNCGEFNERLSDSRPETRQKQDIGSRLRPSVHSATDRCKCNGKTQKSRNIPTFEAKNRQPVRMRGTDVHWRANSTCWFGLLAGERLIDSFKLNVFACAITRVGPSLHGDRIRTRFEWMIHADDTDADHLLVRAHLVRRSCWNGTRLASRQLVNKSTNHLIPLCLCFGRLQVPINDQLAVAWSISLCRCLGATSDSGRGAY